MCCRALPHRRREYFFTRSRSDSPRLTSAAGIRRWRFRFAEDFMRIAMLFAAALAAATPAFGQVLTFDEARKLALQGQPALRALELSARAADESAVADGALPDPRLKFGALNFPTRNFPSAREDMTQVGVSWEQMFPGGDKRRLRTERTLAEAEQARAEALGTRQVILREVGQAWIDAWLAAENARLVGEVAKEYERGIELARIALASGRGSQADVLAARQMLNQATDRRLELAMQAERSRAGLARWIPASSSLPLPDTLPEFRPPAPLAVLRESLESHPQHATQTRAQGVADADVVLAREALKPDRSVEVGYFARGGGRSDMVMFQMAFEIPFFAEKKQDRILESKLTLAERAREQRADHLRMMRAELDAAYAEWRLAGERLNNVAAAILPDAMARLETLSAAHGAATVPLAQVFEARRQLIDARIQELALRAAQAKARIALQYFEHEGAHP
jgi:outer membrane protein TolC